MATLTLEEAKAKIEIKNREYYPYIIIDNVDEVLDEVFKEFNKKIEKLEDNMYNLQIESGVI